MDLNDWYLLMFFGIPFSALVGWMAKYYQRSMIAWFVLSVVFSPVVAFVFLIVAGVPHSAVVRREKEERVRARHPDRSGVREMAMAESSCPRCGVNLNTATGDGVHSPDDEPWRMSCDACGTEIEP